MPNTQRSRGGYTFFELITVIGITIIFGSVALLNLPTGLRTKTEIDNALLNIKAHLLIVQQRSMTQENGQQWGIHFDTSTPGNHFYQIFYGDSYEAGTIVETIYLPDGIIFLSPTEGTNDDIIFEKVTGRTEDGHSIILGLESLLEDPSLSDANAELQVDILLSQQNAIDQLNDSNWGIHADSSTPEEHFYQIFYGDTYETGTIVETIYLPDGILFLSPGDGNVGDLIFENGTGNIIDQENMILGSDLYDDTNSSNLVVASGTGLVQQLASVPDFNTSISLTPSSATILAGGSVQSTVSLNILSGISEVTAFSAIGLPADTTANFSPVSCSPTCSSVTTLQTGAGTPQGPHVITISATAGGLVKSTNFTLNISTQVLPGAPENLSLVGGSGQVSLSWQAPTLTGGSSITNYKIYRGLSSGNLTHVADAGISLSYLDSGLNNGTTYYYKVSAVNGVGEGPQSGESSVSLSATPPGVPENFIGEPATGRAILSWDAPTLNGGSSITNYKIYRSATSGGSLTLIATVGNILTYTNTGLSNGSTYYYNISAVNGVGEGGLSVEVSVALSATPPGAPTNLSGSAGDSQAVLNWSAPSSDGGSAITNYKVYRSLTSGGSLTLIATVGNILTYTNTGLSNGSTYYYKVSAVNGVGEGVLSSESSGVTPNNPVPTAPQNLSATPGFNQAVLTWDAPNPNGGSAVTYYKIYRSATSGGSLTLITTVGNVLTYTNTGLTTGTTYYYKVLAGNAAGDGALSSEASATPNSSAPGAPTITRVAALRSRVAVYWTAASDNGASVTAYKIYRSTISSGASALIATTGNVLQYLDQTTENGTTYYYRILAVNSNGDSPLSNESSVANPNLMVSAFVTSATYNGNLGGLTGADAKCQIAASEAVLGGTWKAWLSDNGTSASSRIRQSIDGYKLLNGTIIATSWADFIDGNHLTPINFNQNGGTSGFFVWTNTSISGGITNTNSCSNWNQISGYYGNYGHSGQASAAWTATGSRNYCGNSFRLYCLEQTAPPSIPRNLSATTGSTAIYLSWDAPSDSGTSAVTNYKVYRGTSSGGEILLVTLGNVLSYDDTGLPIGQDYYYKISAVSSVGEGGMSGELSASTAFGAPTAPQNTSAVGDDHGAILNWQAPADNGGSSVSNYKIYRSTTSGLETLVATIGNALTYSDSGLTNGLTYYYKVSAVNSYGESAQGSEVSSLSGPASRVFITSTTYTGSLGGYTGADNLCHTRATAAGLTGYWSAWLSGPSSNASSRLYHSPYNYRRLDNVLIAENWNDLIDGSLSNPINVNELGSTINSIVWTGTNYTGVYTTDVYGSRSCDDWSTTAPIESNPARVGVSDHVVTSWSAYTVGYCSSSYRLYCVEQIDRTPPSTPVISSTSGTNSVATLNWSAPDSGSTITGYKVYRSTTSGAEILVATLGSALTYADTGLINGTTYYYKISAVSNAGESSLSSEVSVVPHINSPTTPLNLSAVSSVGQVTISWQAPSNIDGSTVTNYKIYRSITSGAETLIATVGNVLTYTDAGLTNGTTYYYKVSAVNGGGEGSLSNELSAYTAPGTPSNLVSVSGESQITLNWQAPASGGSAITGYNIYRGTASGNEALILNTGNSLTSYANTGLVSGGLYYYKIAAVNSVGESLLSNETSTIASTPKKIFITSTSYTGDLSSPSYPGIQGLAGADEKCQVQAEAASLGGNWRAWLSDESNSASERIYHFPGTYTLINGSVVAYNWDDLVDGVLVSPINVTENNVNIWGGATVWTNTDSAGNSVGNVCSNWTSSSGYSADYGGFYRDVGDSNASNSQWTEYGNESWPTIHWCSNSRRLYCIESGGGGFGPAI